MNGGSILLFFAGITCVSCGSKLQVMDFTYPSNFFWDRNDLACYEDECNQWPIDETCFHKVQAYDTSSGRGEQMLCYSGMSVNGGFEWDEINDNDASVLTMGDTIDDEGYLGYEQEMYAIVHICMAGPSPCNTVDAALARIRANVPPIFITLRIDGWCYYGPNDNDVAKNGLDYQKMMDCWMNGTWDMESFADYGADVNLFFYDEVTGYIGSSDDSTDYTKSWATHQILYFCDAAETMEDIHVFAWNFDRKLERDFDYVHWPFPHPRYEMDGDECWRALRDPYYGMKGSSYFVSLSLLVASTAAIFQLFF